jgi:hypothetical protein
MGAGTNRGDEVSGNHRRSRCPCENTRLYIDRVRVPRPPTRVPNTTRQPIEDI